MTNTRKILIVDDDSELREAPASCIAFLISALAKAVGQNAISSSNAATMV